MPKKGENIYKRKDGRWEGRYIKSKPPSGKAIYGYVYGKTYREAKAKLIAASAKAPNFHNHSSERNSVLFETIAWEWFESNKPLVKKSTNNKYQNLLNSYILPAFGSQTLDALTYDFIEARCNDFLATGGVKGLGLSPKTVADILSVVRSILRYAMNHGRIIPCDARTIRVKQHSKEMRVLSRCEQEKLCQYLYSDLNPYNIGILMSLFTGLRVGEICALRWEDVSLSERTIHIHRTMQRVQDHSNTGAKTRVIVTTPKSACSVRTIPLPDNLIGVLSEYQTASTGYFLTNSDCSFIEPRTMQNRFKQALKSSSIAPANYHALRHTFATRCVELGFDVKSLSEILGHASVNITMNRYVHPSMDLKKENMQRLSALLAVK